VKEALFSILLSRFGSLNNLTVLDLFAGTGNLGIEALSRGAARATFVDSHPQSLEIIRRNLDITGFTGRAELVPLDALKALQRLDREAGTFDILFVDPPYREVPLMQRVLEHLADSNIPAPGGLIVFETGSRTVLSLPDNLELEGKRLYGDTAILFIVKCKNRAVQA